MLSRARRYPAPSIEMVNRSTRRASLWRPRAFTIGEGIADEDVRRQRRDAPVVGCVRHRSGHRIRHRKDVHLTGSSPKARTGGATVPSADRAAFHVHLTAFPPMPSSKTPLRVPRDDSATEVVQPRRQNDAVVPLE